MLAPAERVELWVDFSGREMGSSQELNSLEYQHVSHMHRGMRHVRRGGMRNGRGMRRKEVSPGENILITKFHITGKDNNSPELPEKQVKISELKEQNIANLNQSVHIDLSMLHMSPRINGRSFEMYSATKAEKIPVSTIKK